jgi:hypothetical protein
MNVTLMHGPTFNELIRARMKKLPVTFAFIGQNITGKFSVVFNKTKRQTSDIWWFDGQITEVSQIMIQGEKQPLEDSYFADYLPSSIRGTWNPNAPSNAQGGSGRITGSLYVVFEALTGQK